MNRTNAKILVSLATLAAAVLGFWFARELYSVTPQLSAGTWLPQGRALNDFSLLDHTGKPVTLADLRGQPSLLFFGFTHCPDVCPTTLMTLAQIRKKATIENLNIVLVSVDPERDTPQQLATYLAGFGSDLRGLTGTPAALETFGRQFAVLAQRVELPQGGYTMDHSATVFVLNSNAEWVAIFSPPFKVEQIATDLKKVARRLRS
jgi:protein SCO1